MSSTPFRLLLRVRQKLYESGVLPTFQLPFPVISVGNLTVGGTGKTPLVIALAEGLRERGFHPVILSRGYKRTSRGVLVVGNSWEESGDEAYMMSQRLQNVPVVVSANRYEAGLVARSRNLGDLFILDDGFQHRRLHRDVDIVTIDPVEWAEGESLLPSGPWREPKGAMDRAHFACVQDVPDIPRPSVSIPSFLVRTQVDGIYRNNERVSLEAIRGRTIVAFAAIAKPERFFSTLESLDLHPAKCVRFRDHHRFSRREVDELGSSDDVVRITTEKDAVRLQNLNIGDFLWLRVSANIPELDRLLDAIISKCSFPPRV
jgi:tetraacyldisaccharide 4'-kinase